MPNKKSVYFNKGGRRGGYKTGLFHSKKNQSSYTYRSAYEYAYLTKIENDPNVVQYVVEPFQIPYIDEDNKKRTYKPDIIVLYSNGSLEVVEIKPKEMLVNVRVQRKAAAAKIFLKKNYKDSEVTYRFITEEEIFSSEAEYKTLIKQI